MQSGHIALEGAVGLDGDKAALGAQTLALSGDDVQVLGVDLRHHHGDVGREAVGRVVGHHRALVLGIGLLQRTDLVLFHVNGAEHKVHGGSDLFNVGGGVHHDQLFGLLGDGGVHGPAGGDSFLIGLSGAAGAGGDSGQLEPGVVFHQGDKTLTDHAGTANNTNFVLFHDDYLQKKAPAG